MEILQFYIIAFTGIEERRSPSTGKALRVGWRMDANPAGGSGILRHVVGPGRVGPSQQKADSKN
jgi:hypothetical protein